MYQIKNQIYQNMTKNQKSAICNFLRALVKKSSELTIDGILDKFLEDEKYYFEINNAGWWFEPANGFVDVWNSHYNHIMINNKTNTFSINTWCGLSDGYTFTITAYTADGKNSDAVKVVVTK